MNKTTKSTQFDMTADTSFSESSANNNDDDKDIESLKIDDNVVHSNYMWVYAFYHSIVAIIGTGILGFPYATSYLGWYGGTIFITAASAFCYYTATLLIGLQQVGQGTYSEVADAIMGKGYSRYTVRPAQYLMFFPTVAIMILIGGQALSSIDLLVDGKQTLSLHTWTVIDACLVMVLSLLPDLNRAWQVSVMGALSALVIIGYCIGGSFVTMFDDAVSETVEFDRPSATDTSQTYTLLASFGDILFGYGFHAILPDIQASLQNRTKDSKKDTKKAVTLAFALSYPAYLIVALVGYAAFGYDVNSNLLKSLDDVLAKSAMCAVWIFVTFKTATEAAIYNQAAFTLARDTFGLTNDSDDINHHPKNRMLELMMRFVWVVLAALIAIYVPIFSDLTAITAAISIIPLSFLLPIIMWNKKHGATAGKWRLWCHYFALFFCVVLGIMILIGAIADVSSSIKESRIE